MNTKSTDVQSLSQTEKMSAVPLEIEIRNALRSARVLLKKGQKSEAESTVREVLMLDRTSTQAYEILLNIAECSKDCKKYKQVLRTAIENSKTAPFLKGLQFRLAGLARSEAKELVELMFNRWPDDEIVKYLNGVFGETPNLSALTASPAIFPKESSRANDAISLALEGKRKQAFSLLDQEPESGTAISKEHLLNIRQLIEKIPNNRDFSRPLVKDLGEEVTQSERTPSGVTVIFFTSLGIDTTHTFELIDSFFASAGISSIFLRDHTQNVYVRGLKSVGENRVQTQAALVNRLKTLGARRLLVVGRSGGGFGALQYGLELGADKIVTFSAPSDMTSNGPLLARRLQRDHHSDDLNSKFVGK